LSFLFLVISFTGTELDPQFLLFLPFIYLIQQIFVILVKLSVLSCNYGFGLLPLFTSAT
jgi:hypothetical protein